MTAMQVQADRPGRGVVHDDRLGGLVTGTVVGLTTLVIVVAGTVSPELLAMMKVHYISPGGHFFEKIHPATYLAIPTFLLLLLRNGDPIGEFDRIFSNAKLVLVYLFSCGLLLFQCLALKRPITSVVDTFLLPALLGLIVWNLTARQRRPVVIAIHLVIWTNIILGFYEYFSKHRLIPITVGNQILLGDWRATALLGHPASAAAAIALYIMALSLRSRTQQLPLIGWPALLVAAASLMVFGGRTALVAVTVVFFGIALWNCIRLVRGDRFGLATVILTVCGIMVFGAGLSVVVGSGIFDNMLTRFGHDSGSAQARIASVHLLSYFDWKELLLGTDSIRASALQTMLGLNYGVEDFWIACIVQYGIIQTVLLTLGLACFFIELLKRTSPGARVALLFVCVVAASSVSFSSKNIALTLDVMIILLLMPRAAAEGLSYARHVYRSAGAPYAVATPVR
jgi:hypothetical protein